MPKQSIELTTDDAQSPSSMAPLLKNRLRISFVALLLPLFFISIIFFLFFQKLGSAFDYAIDDTISDVVPITQIKDKVQLSIIPFNRFSHG